VLTPPGDLIEESLAATLAAHWHLTPTALAYRPVGWGSHHWDVTDTGGTRWFVTVDELENKRHTENEALDVACGRLRAALGAARDLYDAGATFAVAPVPTNGGEPLARHGTRFAVAVYPFVEGRSFVWGDPRTPEDRRAVLDLVIRVHTAPESTRRRAMADDFTIPYRDALVAALDGNHPTDTGPYAERVAGLMHDHAVPLRRLLARYDAFPDAGNSPVLTHGEPHPANTMRTADGWRLIDWDTTLVAPPERDLWMLTADDDSVLRAYRDATGVTPQQHVLDRYRLRWDLSDLAIEVSRFRRPHTGSVDDDKGWGGLCHLTKKWDEATDS
jgi:hypothetical protein